VLIYVKHTHKAMVLTVTLDKGNDIKFQCS